MTTTPAPQERESSLRPRVIDVSDVEYSTATSYVDADETAYFERKHGHTTLVVR